MTARDPRDHATYGLTEAASLLRVPAGTLRRWVRGPGTPLIALPDPARTVLSFTNLVEAHVLAALRRVHSVRMTAIRDGVEYLTVQLGHPRPLARADFETDGVDLFITHLETLFNVSRQGQVALRSVVGNHLRRVERDSAGLATRLYPFTRVATDDAPRVVVIDPRIAFGRPIIAGTGAPTDVVIGRYLAGESVDALADDYGCGRDAIEEVLRGALPKAA